MADGLACAKMHGAGNDFIVLPEPEFDADTLSQWIQAACHRTRGLGADGVVLLSLAEPGTFKLRFFNCDGGAVDLCLNGTRCAVLRLVQLGWAPDGKGELLSHLGPMSFEVSGDVIRLGFRVPALTPVQIEVPCEGVSRPATYVPLADPHLVVPFTVPEFDDLHFERLGYDQRWSKAFEHGVNVHAVAKAPDGEILIRSYERGVEAETEACGSGCVASALALGLTTATFRTGGGDRIQVTAGKDAQWTLGGPAVLVAEVMCQLAPESSAKP